VKLVLLKYNIALACCFAFVLYIGWGEVFISLPKAPLSVKRIQKSTSCFFIQSNAQGSHAGLNKYRWCLQDGTFVISENDENGLP